MPEANPPSATAVHSPAVGTIVIFRQGSGTEHSWVPHAEEEWWIRWWGKQGVPAVRLADYRRWGGFYPPTNGNRVSVTLRPEPRRRTNYRRWQPPQ